MAYVEYYTEEINKTINGNGDSRHFSKEKVWPKSCFDDLQMIQMRKDRARVFDIKMCNNPRLNYLNIFDYGRKRGNFHSSYFGCLEVLGKLPIFKKAYETFDEYISASIFIFYVKHLRTIPKDSIDLKAFDQKIHHIVENLRHCESHLFGVIFDETMRIFSTLPSEKILIPIIMKYICTFEGLITYAAEYFQTTRSLSFFKEILEACIENRFNFWTMWERNQNLNTMPFCPVTYAMFQEKFDFLRVLLDYGFHQTHQRVRTVEILVDEHYRDYEYSHLLPGGFKSGPSSRISVIYEVFLFIRVFIDSFSRPDTLVKSFQLAWNARKDPYVTKQELFRNYPPDFDESKDPFGGLFKDFEWKDPFVELFKVFETALPENVKLVAEPRSLQHLCRCTIREALNDNWQMPHGVAKLPVPEQMKSYILLK